MRERRKLCTCFLRKGSEKESEKNQKKTREKNTGCTNSSTRIDCSQEKVKEQSGRKNLPEKRINKVKKNRWRDPKRTRFESRDGDQGIKFAGESPEKKIILVFSFHHKQFG